MSGLNKLQTGRCLRMAGSSPASFLVGIVQLNLRAFNYGNTAILRGEAGWWIQQNWGGLMGFQGGWCRSCVPSWEAVSRIEWFLRAEGNVMQQKLCTGTGLCVLPARCS